MQTSSVLSCRQPPVQKPSGGARDPSSHQAVLAQHRPHICPWWLSWTLVSPVRKWLGNDPELLLGSFVRSGDRVLEVGPGPGFYTVPLAKRVGPDGKVVCIDLQPRMLEALRKRLARKGLADRMETHLCSSDSLGTADRGGSMDRAVLIYVLHEMPDPRRTLAEVFDALRSGGELLLVEPKRHCPAELFAAELWAAEQVGFTSADVALWDELGKYQAAVLVRRI
jgi:SAM-dependent methyltransferase